MTAPIVSLSPKWSATKKNKVAASNIQLGDGYNLIMSIGTDSRDETWDIESPGLNETEALNYKQLFEQLAGVDQFLWSPVNLPPLKAYICASWRITPIGYGYYRISATFESFTG